MDIARRDSVVAALLLAAAGLPIQAVAQAPTQPAAQAATQTAPQASTQTAAQAPTGAIAIGYGSNVTSIDPHFHNAVLNRNFSAHIFDRLVHQDEQNRLVPGLAERWRAIDDTTWEFTLRRGVRFHDGTPFDAEDVLASLRRAPAVPNSPSSFGLYTRPILEATAPDPFTLRIRTRGPYPLLPIDLSNISIIARSFETATTADFNAGRAAIGTGAFRFTAWLPGEALRLGAHAEHWAGAPPWSQASLRIMVNDPARVAALLAGEIQVADRIPSADVARLARDPALTLLNGRTTRLIYMHMDQHRAVTPHAATRSGQPLERNPLLDPRVRLAISKAIDRPAITTRLLEGLGEPAGGLIPDGFYGATPERRPEALDVAGARRLLAEAGYPDGFVLTLHAPNDAFPSDERVAQAVAQMLARIGITTRVEVLPWSVFVQRGSNLEFSAFIAAAGAPTGEASVQLRSLIATFNRERGLGVLNRGRYSNPAFDTLLDRAMQTIPDAGREALLRQATNMALDDQAVIPIYYQLNVTGLRRGHTMVVRADEQTLAADVRRSGP
jgi:peptide/nickel transport system substrate-binding protein